MTRTRQPEEAIQSNFINAERHIIPGLHNRVFKEFMGHEKLISM